jgi:hypothetical protein
MTNQNPTIEELRKMSYEELSETYDEPMHDLKRLKYASGYHVFPVLTDHTLSTIEMARRLGITSNEARDCRYELIKNGLDVKKPAVVGEYRKPKRESILVYLRNAELKSATTEELSKKLKISIHNIDHLVDELKKEGKVVSFTIVLGRIDETNLDRPIMGSKKKQFVYFPEQNTLCGKRVTKELPLKITRLTRKKLVPKIKPQLPHKDIFNEVHAYVCNHTFYDAQE